MRLEQIESKIDQSEAPELKRILSDVLGWSAVASEAGDHYRTQEALHHLRALNEFEAQPAELAGEVDRTRVFLKRLARGGKQAQAALWF